VAFELQASKSDRLHCPLPGVFLGREAQELRKLSSDSHCLVADKHSGPVKCSVKYTIRWKGSWGRVSMILRPRDGGRYAAIRDGCLWRPRGHQGSEYVAIINDGKTEKPPQACSMRRLGIP
jgi:hypothetical protein